MTAEHKANINFWFRHIFEFSSPIIPGMLMACSIAAIPFSSLLLHLAWVTPLFFLVGWLILMRPLKLPPHIITETGKVNFTKELKTLCFAVAPVAANFILITAFNFTAAAKNRRCRYRPFLPLYHLLSAYLLVCRRVMLP